MVDNGTFDIAGSTGNQWIISLSGSGTVNLGGNTLTLTHSSGTFAGVIRGSGGLSVGTGLGNGGTATLSGVNTYTGATTIYGLATLALSGSGSIAGSSGVTVYGSGIFDISGSTSGQNIVTLSGTGNVNLGANSLTLTHASSTFAGIIGGSGGLAIGGGSEVLTGANTYTGGTTISAGTLQVGDGGTTGSITGDVTDNGILAFDHSDNVTFGNIISGSGGLSQLGTGTLTLTGANTYAGVTTISAGMLQVGIGGTGARLGRGAVLDNGVLVFDNADAATYAGAISGSGSLVQQGSGTIILNGVNTYTGGTTVAAGTLQIGDAAHPGASVSGDVMVLGGMLAGHGSIGGSVTNQGAVVRPGGSPGILAVAGNYTQDAAGTLAIEITPSTQAGTGYSQLNVAGTATLDGTLAFLVDPGTYLPTSQYDVVHADGGISGTFSSVTFTPNMALYITPEVNYAANDVYLYLKPNGIVFTGSYVNYANTVSLGVENDMQAVLGPVTATAEGRRGAWGQYVNGRAGIGAAHLMQQGVAAGVGTAVGEGGTIGVALTGDTAHTRIADMNVQSKPIGGFAYGIWRNGGWRLAVSFGVGRINAHTKRSIPLLGLLATSTTHGMYNATAVRASYTLGWGRYGITPYVGYDQVNSRYDAAQETGAGFLSLALGKWSQHQGHYTTGIRLDTDAGAWRPWVQAGVEGWRGAGAGQMDQTVLGYTQTVTGQRMPSHAMNAGAGVNYHHGRWDTSVSWNGAWGSSFHDNDGTLQVRYRW